MAEAEQGHNSRRLFFFALTSPQQKKDTRRLMGTRRYLIGSRNRVDDL